MPIKILIVTPPPPLGGEGILIVWYMTYLFSECSYIADCYTEVVYLLLKGQDLYGTHTPLTRCHICQTRHLQQSTPNVKLTILFLYKNVTYGLRYINQYSSILDQTITSDILYDSAL